MFIIFHQRANIQQICATYGSEYWYLILIIAWRKQMTRSWLHKCEGLEMKELLNITVGMIFEISTEHMP